MLSRRNFLKLAGVSAAGVAASAVAFQTLDFNGIEYLETVVPIPNLPDEFVDYRIGYLSDLHLGLYIPREWIERAAKMIHSAHPDILLLGGDYIWLQDAKLAKLFGNYSDEEYSDKSKLERSIFTSVADIVTASKYPDGIHAVYGNHDRWVHPDDCKRIFGEHNVNFMINDVHVVRRGKSYLSLVGLDDYWTGRPKLPNLPSIKEKNELRILSVHNPDYMRIVLDRGFNFDLAVCGHTHGGQIKIPGIGALVHNIRDMRFFEGLCRVTESYVYTSRGIGMVELPIRINCPSEVTVLHLTRA